MPPGSETEAATGAIGGRVESAFLTEASPIATTAVALEEDPAADTLVATTATEVDTTETAGETSEAAVAAASEMDSEAASRQEEGVEEGQDRAAPADESQQAAGATVVNTRGLIMCETCFCVFKERRYLALHVRSRKCRGSKNGIFQCPRCGRSGGEGWAASHDFIAHRQKWEEGWVML